MGVLRELGDDLYYVGIARVGVAKAQPARGGASYAIDATRLRFRARFGRDWRTLLRTQIRDVLGVEVLQPLGGSLREGIVSPSVLGRHSQLSHGVCRVHEMPRRPLVRVGQLRLRAAQQTLEDRI